MMQLNIGFGDTMKKAKQRSDANTPKKYANHSVAQSAYITKKADDQYKASLKDLRQSSETKVKVENKLLTKTPLKKEPVNTQGLQTIKIYNNISKRIWIQRRE